MPENIATPDTVMDNVTRSPLLPPKPSLKPPKSANPETIIEMADLEDPTTPGDGVDGRGDKNFWTRILPKSSQDKKETFASKKTAAEGMMDIALLTANANQLRFLFTYNTESKTYVMSVSLIIASLILQVAVGVTLIFKRQMKNKGRRASWTNDFLVVGVFLVTVINVFAASFTITNTPPDGHHPQPSHFQPPRTMGGPQSQASPALPPLGGH